MIITALCHAELVSASKKQLITKDSELDSE
jgi:hypothetical protein